MVTEPAEAHAAQPLLAAGQDAGAKPNRAINLPLITGAGELGTGELVQPASEPRDWLFHGADEVFRSIYTRAGIGANEVLAVSSAIAGEGKTALSLGLGVTIAQDYPDRRVLVVETDLQHPVLAEDFALEPGPGLADCLEQSLPVPMAYRQTYLPNLHLVPAGGPTTSASRLLRSSRMAMAVDAMRQSHDVVILDLPAILVTSDALLLSDLADGVILVVRSGVTPSALVNKAIEQLDDERLRGVVLNGAQSSLPRWLRRICGME
jgi:capsular exopolysaccharide synthesis family protein